MPGARTVTAGPAMRTSDCIARIAGSMKPVFRKWPMVAGSAFSNFATSCASSGGGRLFRVNTTELLDIGERRVAQTPDVAPRVDHVVAALEHLAPGGAGMRHGAHRLPAFPDRFLGVRDQFRDFRVLKVAELPDGTREIVRTDEEDVDAFDRRDRADVLDRFRRLDLHHDQQLVRRLALVFR